MHDYGAVGALIDHLANETQSACVAEVVVRASPVFAPEALEQAYEILTDGTPLAGSILVVEGADEHRTCRMCKEDWMLSRDDVIGHSIACPSCGFLSPFDLGSGIQILAVKTRDAAPSAAASRQPSPEPFGRSHFLNLSEQGADGRRESRPDRKWHGQS